VIPPRGHSSTVPRTHAATARWDDQRSSSGAASDTRNAARLARRLEWSCFRADRRLPGRGFFAAGDFLAAPSAPPTWPRALGGLLSGRRFAARPFDAAGFGLRCAPLARNGITSVGADAAGPRQCDAGPGVALETDRRRDAERLLIRFGRRSAGAPTRPRAPGSRVAPIPASTERGGRSRRGFRRRLRELRGYDSAFRCPRDLEVRRRAPQVDHVAVCVLLEECVGKLRSLRLSLVAAEEFTRLRRTLAGAHGSSTGR